jgi:RNA polymerase sigma factor (sigma-70 family)
MADHPNKWKVEEVLAHSAWIRRLARRLVADAADRDDVVGEAWLNALRQGQRTHLQRWLSRCSSETAVERHAPPTTPEKTLERVRIELALSAAILDVDEPYRSTLLWRCFNDVPVSEIARRSGIPSVKIRWRLKRGIEVLRARLDLRFDGDRRRWSIALIPTAAAARGRSSRSQSRSSGRHWY